MRKTQLSLWLRKAPADAKEYAASFVKVLLSRLDDLNTLSKARLANWTWLLDSLTGFAVLGELEAEGLELLSNSRSSNMSTPERTIQETASRIANAF